MLRSLGTSSDRGVKWFRGDSLREQTSDGDEFADRAIPQKTRCDAGVDASIRELEKSVRQLLRREERMVQRIHGFESEVVAELALLTDMLRNLQDATEAIERRLETAERRL